MDKQYYLDIIKKINDLCNKKEYEKAFNIIQEEINQPYIPNEFINQFEQLYLQINQLINVQRIQNKYNNMSKLELLSQAYNEKKLDVNIFSYFLAKFVKDIDDVDFQYINKIFKNKDIENTEKIFILKQIKDSELKYDFNYFNKNLNKEFLINSQSSFEVNLIDYYVQVDKLIEKILFKNPSNIALAHELLSIIYEHYFNLSPKFDVMVLADKLTRYVNAYFEPKNLPDPEFKI
jgi:hypothetical protein